MPPVSSRTTWADTGPGEGKARAVGRRAEARRARGGAGAEPALPALSRGGGGSAEPAPPTSTAASSCKLPLSWGAPAAAEQRRSARARRTRHDVGALDDLALQRGGVQELGEDRRRAEVGERLSRGKEGDEGGVIACSRRRRFCCRGLHLESGVSHGAPVAGLARKDAAASRHTGHSGGPPPRVRLRSPRKSRQAAPRKCSRGLHMRRRASRPARRPRRPRSGRRLAGRVSHLYLRRERESRPALQSSCGGEPSVGGSESGVAGPRAAVGGQRAIQLEACTPFRRAR